MCDSSFFVADKSVSLELINSNVSETKKNNNDNSYMIDIFSKIENVRISTLAENQERFKMLNYRIPNKQYNIKIYR